MSTVKDQIRELAERLPDSATWDEVMYEIYVRQKIADGEIAIAEDRSIFHGYQAARITGICQKRAASAVPLGASTLVR